MSREPCARSSRTVRGPLAISPAPRCWTATGLVGGGRRGWCSGHVLEGRSSRGRVRRTMGARDERASDGSGEHVVGYRASAGQGRERAVREARGTSASRAARARAWGGPGTETRTGARASNERCRAPGRGWGAARIGWSVEPDEGGFHRPTTRAAPHPRPAARQCSAFAMPTHDLSRVCEQRKKIVSQGVRAGRQPAFRGARGAARLSSCVPRLKESA